MCILVESSIYVNKSLLSYVEQKGRNLCSPRFRSYREFHQPPICTTATATSQKTSHSPKSLQCGWHYKSERWHNLPFRLRGLNRRKCTNMRFFLTELGPQWMILGYPWFAAMQPKIDWAKGWINYTQFSIIVKTPNAHKSTLVSQLKAMVHGKQWKAIIQNAEVPRLERNHVSKEY